MPEREAGGPPPYDAILIVSFGGPEGPADVIPFLENVTRGRGVPPERLAQVARQYDQFGGISPINGQNRALVAALEGELAEHGPRLPVYWGNRNWHPLLADTAAAMAADGIRHALAFVTSAYSSYSSCRQYREDIARARQLVGDGAPVIDKIRPFFNHPGFVEPIAANVSTALDAVPAHRRSRAHLAFTAHSIPQSMAATSDYVAQLEETARLVADRLPSRHPWQLAFQSRSGPPAVPWLEPDIGDHLATLHSQGVDDVVVAPIGFVSDHMEVRYDLDVVAARRAAELGIGMVRAATVGTAPAFVSMVRELIVERIEVEPVRRALGQFGPRPDTCEAGCCPPPPRSVGG